MHSLANTRDTLSREAAPFISGSGEQWFLQALKTLVTSTQVVEDLGLFSAIAKRKLGKEKLTLSPAIDTQFSPLDIRHWSVSDIARLILLMTVILEKSAQTETLIRTYYRIGDESERIALIRGLIFFAPASYLTEIALDVGRTNNLEVLAALSLDNPYPCCFYSEAEFNQMVLKALFLGLAIERIAGLEQRANTDLTRMCENYVVEREEANRSVPVDIWLAIGPFASETGQQQMLKYLDHEDIGHRYYCTQSLIQRLSQDPSLLSVLKQRLDIEQEPRILQMLQDNLTA